MRWIVLLVFLASCSTAKKEKKPTINPIHALLETRETYLALLPSVQGEAGFLEDQECDSLLWSGLAAASGAEVQLSGARESTGKWHRTPAKDCYLQKRSGSEISKDMLVGLEWGLWIEGDQAALADLYQYGNHHDWIMGAGSLDRTYFHAPFQNTLRVLLGKDPSIPEFYVDPLKDHQRHILALDIVLRGEAQGKISESAFELLKSWSKKEPENALFQFGYHRYSDGEQGVTIDILKRFPLDRLPESRDWCGRWLWERSQYSEHWEPCGEDKTHSGGDFLFIVGLLERSQP